MSLQDRIESLKAKHAALDTAIEAETRRPYPDSTAIKSMKQKKLQVKDELSRMGGPSH